MKVNFKKYFAILLMFFTIVIGTASWVIVGEKSFIAGQHSVSSAVAYIIGKESVKYTSIEKALDVAVSGEIVVVVPPTLDNYHDTNNKVTPDKVTYYITRDCEIKEGVSLVIPTDAKTLSTVTDKSSLNTYITSMYTDDRARGSSSSYSKFATANPNYYLRVTIEVADNVTITNNGTLVISGYLSGGTSGAGINGQTSHSYSKIVLGENSKIVQSSTNAISYCLGYIEEASTNSFFELMSGKLYIPFIVNDYRGFSFSWSMTDGAIDTERCSPFNQISFINILSEIKISYYAQVYAYSNVYVTYSGVTNIDEVFTNILPVVGNTNEFLIQFTDSIYSSLIYNLDSNLINAKIVFYGGNKLNQFELNLSKSGVTVNLSTTNAYFPLSYRFNIELKAAEGQELATFDITNQRIKILPGCNFTINDNCQLKANEIIIYSAFYDGSLGNGKASANMYNSVKYPIKDGGILKVMGSGKIEANALAGCIYSDKSNISYQTNSIVSKEAWSYILSGEYYPAWVINDYLEIREKLDIKSISDFSKNKIFVGLNIFTKYNTLLPEINLVINDVNELNISEYQRVIHFDNIVNYKVELINNIYKIYYSNMFYKKNSVINYDSNNDTITAINSIVDISSNNSLGKNEFDVQGIDVTCTTPYVNGKPPLYIDKTIQLEANIDNYDKIYDRDYMWYSGDESIAIVDSATGKVTGKALGLVTIYIICDGVIGSINLEVLTEEDFINVTGIYIYDSKNNTSEDETAETHATVSKDTSETYTVKILPENAVYSSIEWKLTKSSKERQWITDNTVSSETVSNELSITVNFGDPGATPDYPSITCTVYDLNENKFESTFKINHVQSSGGCLLPGTLVTMADGTKKPVEQIQPGDMLKVFNHYTGEYDVSPVVFNDSEPKQDVNVINLEFSNGSNIGVVYEHGFFDLDLMKYVYIDEYNYNDYVGHRFYSDGNNIVTLNRAYITTQYTEVYSPVTAYHLNYFTEDILSMPGGIEGLFNIFEYDDDLKYNEELMKQDIEKYGLYTYDDFKDYCSYEFYQAFPAEYLKVAVGKGYITFDEIIYLINRYKNKV